MEIAKICRFSMSFGRFSGSATCEDALGLLEEELSRETKAGIRAFGLMFFFCSNARSMPCNRVVNSANFLLYFGILAKATTGPVRRVDWDQSLVELTHNTRPGAVNVEQIPIIFKS